MSEEPDIYTAYDNLSLPVLVFDLNGMFFLYMNESASDLFKKFNITDVGSVDDIFEFIKDYSLHEFQSILKNTKNGKFPRKLMLSAKNEIQWFDVLFSKGMLNKSEILTLTLNDVTDSKNASFILEDVFRFRDMLYRIVEKNNSISTDEVPGLIDESLELIGKFFKCDRVYVCTEDPDRTSFSKLAEWFGNGVTGYGGKSGPLSKDEVEWSLKRVFNEGMLLVTDISDLPEEAEMERRLMLEWKVKSYVILPIFLNDDYTGYLGMEYVKHEKRWEKHDISNLKFITRNIANLLIRYRHESYLIEKEFLYQSLFVSANDSILIFRNGICVDCSKKALELFNCTRDEIIGLKGEEFAAEEENFSKEKAKEKLSDEGTIFASEYLTKRPDGSKFYAEISLSRKLINDIVYVVSIYRDISKVKKSLHELKNREDHLQNKLKQLLAPDDEVKELTIKDIFDVNQLQALQDTLVEALGVSSYFADAEGRPVTIPKSINKICDLINSTPGGKALCHETALLLRDKSSRTKLSEYLPCLTCGFIDAYAPIIVDGIQVGSWIVGQVIPADYKKSDLKKHIGPLGVDVSKAEELFDTLPRFDSEKLKKTVDLLTILSNELSTLGYNNLKLARTVKEHIALEKELREAKNKAEESDRLKSAFLANMSHEIRTPMNGIVGFADLLDVEMLLPEERKEYVSLIKQSSQQLLSIINDIIDISKIESGQVDVNITRFSIGQMFNDLHSFFKRQIDNDKVELILDKSTSGEMSVEILSDDVKLRQVLTNLLSNAIKFTDKGYVKFGYSVVQDKLKFFVEDTGEGIAKKDIGNIFNRFWQLRQNRPGKGGTGLGLAISKAYVELLDGEIDVVSELKRGTTFTVTIPLR